MEKEKSKEISSFLHFCETYLKNTFSTLDQPKRNTKIKKKLTTENSNQGVLPEEPTDSTENIPKSNFCTFSGAKEETDKEILTPEIKTGQLLKEGRDYLENLLDDLLTKIKLSDKRSPEEENENDLSSEQESDDCFEELNREIQKKVDESMFVMPQTSAVDPRANGGREFNLPENPVPPLEFKNSSGLLSCTLCNWTMTDNSPQTFFDHCKSNNHRAKLKKRFANLEQKPKEGTKNTVNEQKGEVENNSGTPKELLEVSQKKKKRKKKKKKQPQEYNDTPKCTEAETQEMEWKKRLAYIVQISDDELKCELCNNLIPKAHDFISLMKNVLFHAQGKGHLKKMKNLMLTAPNVEEKIIRKSPQNNQGSEAKVGNKCQFCNNQAICNNQVSSANIQQTNSTTNKKAQNVAITTLKNNPQMNQKVQNKTSVLTTQEVAQSNQAKTQNKSQDNNNQANIQKNKTTAKKTAQNIVTLTSKNHLQMGQNTQGDNGLCQNIQSNNIQGEKPPEEKKEVATSKQSLNTSSQQNPKNLKQSPESVVLQKEFLCLLCNYLCLSKDRFRAHLESKNHVEFQIAKGVTYDVLKRNLTDCRGCNRILIGSLVSINEHCSSCN